MLNQMAPGGKWVRPPHDAPPVYVPAKQIEAHFKRLISDGWIPVEDPRREDQTTGLVAVQAIAPEVAMQAKIDQLEALVKQLLTQKSETKTDGTSTNHVSADIESPSDDRGSAKRKPAVR